MFGRQSKGVFPESGWGVMREKKKSEDQPQRPQIQLESHEENKENREGKKMIKDNTKIFSSSKRHMSSLMKKQTEISTNHIIMKITEHQGGEILVIL